MKHEFYTDEEKKLIRCTLEGELDVDESVRLADILRKKAAETGCNVLYDARKLVEPRSIMPVYDFTVKLSSILDQTILRAVKVAFLYKAGKFDDYWKFYEDLATNRGLLIKVFTNKTEAVKWLTE